MGSANMNEIQIPYSGIEESFKWRQSHTLDDSRPHQACMALRAEPSPNATYDNQSCPKEEEMSFAPNTSRRDEQDSSKANATQVIPSEQCGILICYLELEKKLKRFGGKLRCGHSAHDGKETKNA